MGSNCIKTLNGHEDNVQSLVLLPNGNLISCSKDKTIKVWNVGQELCSKTLIGHAESVDGIILLDNDNLASASNDKLIKILNLETGDCIVRM